MHCEAYDYPERLLYILVINIIKLNKIIRININIGIDYQLSYWKKYLRTINYRQWLDDHVLCKLI